MAQPVDMFPELATLHITRTLLGTGLFASPVHAARSSP
jgi:hypothetical protein